MADDHILLEQSERIATITLNRPDKLNAFAGSMREDLLTALDQTARDPGVRVVIITGAGRAFSAGGDIDAMKPMQANRDTESFRRLLEAGGRIVTTIRKHPRPVIASINGVAAGAGCNLALACDYRIAAEHAKLGETFVRIGLHPDWGGTFFLPRLVGTSRAMEILMSGRMVEAAEAFRIGMIDRIVPSNELTEETRGIARSFADGPPLAIADIKRAVYGSADIDLDGQLSVETAHQIQAFSSADAAEGMDAFSSRRPPRFRGE